MCGCNVLQLITITDGEPTNEPEQKIFQVIKRVKDFMGQTPYGSNAIAFQFAQARDSTRAGHESRRIEVCLLLDTGRIKVFWQSCALISSGLLHDAHSVPAIRRPSCAELHKKYALQHQVCTKCAKKLCPSSSGPTQRPKLAPLAAATHVGFVTWCQSHLIPYPVTYFGPRTQHASDPGMWRLGR